MRTSILVITAVLAGILMMPGGLLAKELSGNEAAVMEMFENFNELETHFRNGKWDEAEKVVNTVESEYLALVGKLKGKVDSKTLQKFNFLLNGFKKTMSRKHAEDMEKPYMKLQDLFVDIMEQLDYEAPPALIITELYVEEAKEFLEQGDLHQVAEEMEEIEFFADRAMKEAKEHNIDAKQIKKLLEMAEEVNELAEDNKGTDKIAKMLEDMDAIIDQYVEDD